MREQNRFPKLKKLTRKQEFLLLSLLPVYFIMIGFMVQPFPEIILGMERIIREPDFLITDYFAVGGVGAALINAGLITLMSIAIIYFLHMDMTGHTITSACLMFGFSLFGKNIVNIWAILAGVWLYARSHRTPIQRYIYIGLYGTSLSPIMTEIMMLGEYPLMVRLALSISTGLSIGFVLPPLSTHVHFAHMGYSLYNVGFAAGIIATVAMSLAKSFGIQVRSRLIWSVGNNGRFSILLSLLFLTMIGIGIFVQGKGILGAYRRILKTSGISGTDYLRDEGGAATLFNMGINGLFATWFVLAVGGELNGPVICGIFTIVGFSATGKHLRNIVPIMLGVYLASFTKVWSIEQPSPLLALLFSTTLAPVAGKFGPIAGIIAGYLHSSVAIHIGVVYGGMNLYNNGFAGAIVAIFMVPVIQAIEDRRARAKGGISL